MVAQELAWPTTWFDAGADSADLTGYLAQLWEVISGVKLANGVELNNDEYVDGPDPDKRLQWLVALQAAIKEHAANKAKNAAPTVTTGPTTETTGPTTGTTGRTTGTPAPSKPNLFAKAKEAKDANVEKTVTTALDEALTDESKLNEVAEALGASPEETRELLKDPEFKSMVMEEMRAG